MAASCRPLYGKGATIAAHHAQRVREKARKVVLAHRKAHHAHVAVVARQQGNRELVRRHSQRLRVRSQPLSLRRLVGLGPHRCNHHVVPSANALRLGGGLRAQRGPGVRTGKSGEEGGGASIPAGGRKEVAQSRLIGDVRITIESYVESGGPGCLDAFQHRVDPGPV